MFSYYLFQQYILQQQYKKLYYKLINRQVEPADISGVWNTDYYGRVVFEQEGSNVKGTFKYGDGTIEGTLNGNILTGQWSDTPTYECPLNQGRFRFVFSPQGDSFIGVWGLCQQGLNKDWSGFKLQDAPAIDVSGQWFTTTFGKMNFTQNIDRVTGTYEYKNGKIEGVLNGYTLKGYWSSQPSYNCYYDKGRIEIDFNLKGDAFTGVYGYCEEEPKKIFSGISVENRKYT